MTSFNVIVYHVPVFNAIYSYLCFVDRICLSITCTDFYKYIFKRAGNDLIKVIRSRLNEKLGDTSNAILQDHLITGGFLVDCLYDMNLCHDIDLIITKKEDNLSFIDLHQISINYIRNNKIEKIENNSYYFNVQGYDFINSLKNIIPVDQIQLRCITIEQYMKSYDLDFCRNTFDGKKDGIVKIYSTESVIYKRKVITEEIIDKLTYFISYLPLCNNCCEHNPGCIKMILYNYIDRIEKYRKRGFNIIETLNHAQIARLIQKNIVKISGFTHTWKCCSKCLESIPFNHKGSCMTFFEPWILTKSNKSINLKDCIRVINKKFFYL